MLQNTALLLQHAHRMATVTIQYTSITTRATETETENFKSREQSLLKSNGHLNSQEISYCMLTERTD